MNTYVRKGTAADVVAVTALYRSLVGTPGCVWNEYYPTAEDVRSDAENNSLYVLCDESGAILGGAAAVVDDEQDMLDCWNREMKNPCELSRVGVRSDCQHHGLARQLILYIEADAYRRGFDGIRLLASKTNNRAVALYAGLGYVVAGEAEMYNNGLYLCYEKKLSP